jgi:predicted DNA-binding transcriptional regulator YafY
VSTSSRLLALLSLLQSPRAWSGSELAERLEVSRRTVRRDVDRLRDLGYPVEGTLGVDGGYRLVAGAAMPPLLLDDEEAVAIAIGLRTAAGNAVAGIDEASVRALAKLEQVLPPRLRGRVAALGAATRSLTWDEPAVDPATLTAIARAIGSGDRLRFAYRAPDGSQSRRDVEPNGLVVMGRRWYLLAWDADRADWRTFRVDRVSDPWNTRSRGPRHALPDGLDAPAFVRRQQLAQAPTYRMVATVHAPADRVARRLGDVAEVESFGSDRCRVTSAGDTLDWLAFRLLQLEADFEIHEPVELVEHVRRLGDRLRRAGAGQGPMRR